MSYKQWVIESPKAPLFFMEVVSNGVTYLVSRSEIGSTEIAMLVCEKNISATALDYILNIMDSQDSLLPPVSKGQVIYFMLLRS